MADGAMDRALAEQRERVPLDKREEHDEWMRRAALLKTPEGGPFNPPCLICGEPVWPAADLAFKLSSEAEMEELMKQPGDTAMRLSPTNPDGIEFAHRNCLPVDGLR